MASPEASTLFSHRTIFAVLAAVAPSVSVPAAWWGLGGVGLSPQSYKPTTRYYTFEAVEVEWGIARGMSYRAWTYDG